MFTRKFSDNKDIDFEKERPYYISILFRNWNPEEMMIKWTSGGQAYTSTVAPGREGSYRDIILSADQPGNIEFSVFRVSDQKQVYINGAEIALVTPSIIPEDIVLVISSGASNLY